MFVLTKNEKQLAKAEKKIAEKVKTVYWRIHPFAAKKIVIEIEGQDKVTLDESTKFDLFGSVPKVAKVLEEIKTGAQDGSSLGKKKIKKLTKKASKEIKKALKSDSSKLNNFRTQLYTLFNIGCYNNDSKAVFVLHLEEDDKKIAKVIEALLKQVFKAFEVELRTLKTKDLKKAMKVKSKKRKKAIRKLVAATALGDDGEDRLLEIEKDLYPVLMNAEIIRRLNMGKDPSKICTRKGMKKLFKSFNKKKMKKFEKAYKKYRKIFKSLDIAPKKLSKLRDEDAVVFLRYYMGKSDKSIKTDKDLMEFIQPVAVKFRGKAETLDKEMKAILDPKKA